MTLQIISQEQPALICCFAAFCYSVEYFLISYYSEDQNTFGLTDGQFSRLRFLDSIFYPLLYSALAELNDLTQILLMFACYQVFMANVTHKFTHSQQFTRHDKYTTWLLYFTFVTCFMLGFIYHASTRPASRIIAETVLLCILLLEGIAYAILCVGETKSYYDGVMQKEPFVMMGPRSLLMLCVFAQSI